MPDQVPGGPPTPEQVAAYHAELLYRAQLHRAMLGPTGWPDVAILRTRP